MKGNNHLQVLDARAQSGPSGTGKGGSHQSERKRYLVLPEMLREGKPTNPKAGWLPAFFIYFFPRVWEVIVADSESKTSLQGHPFSGLIELDPSHAPDPFLAHRRITMIETGLLVGNTFVIT